MYIFASEKSLTFEVVHVEQKLDFAFNLIWSKGNLGYPGVIPHTTSTPGTIS